MNKKRHYRAYNTVRTDALEGKIALYRYLGDIRTAEAFEKLARDIGAPVRSAEIERLIAMHKAFSS